MFVIENIPHRHVIMPWAFVKWLELWTVAISHGHLIVIWYLLCCLRTTKINGEAAEKVSSCSGNSPSSMHTLMHPSWALPCLCPAYPIQPHIFVTLCHLKSCCAVIVLYHSHTQEATYLPLSLFVSHRALLTICQLPYWLWLLEAGRKLWRSAHLMACYPCLMTAMGLQRLLLLSDSVTWHHALWLRNLAMIILVPNGVVTWGLPLFYFAM